MGYAESKCVNVGIDVNQILLQCHNGYVGIIYDFGYIAQQEDKDVCMRNASLSGGGVCHDSYDSKSMQIEFNNKCVGQKNCTIKDLKKYLRGPHASKCSDREAHFFI
jgi:hypothetical protein